MKLWLASRCIHRAVSFRCHNYLGQKTAEKDSLYLTNCVQISLLQDKHPLQGSGLLPFRSVVSEEDSRRITELYDEICNEEKALSDLIDDAEDVADYVTEDVAKRISALKGETKRDQDFVTDLRNGLTKVLSDGASKAFASELCTKWLAKPKQSIPEIANLTKMQAFLREKQTSLLPRHEKLETRLSKDKFWNVYILFTWLNPLESIVDELQKKHEYYWKLREDEKGAKSSFLIVDVGIHTSHQSKLSQVKLYCQGKEGALVPPRQTTEVRSSVPSVPPATLSAKPASDLSASQAASQAEGGMSQGDSASTNDTTNLCQQCKHFDEENQAEFICISGCKSPYYCKECWEDAHKRPKLRQHKRKRVSNPFKFERKQTSVSLAKNEEIPTLPKSSLPWKTLAPGLFQLYKVVLDDADYNSIEKVVIVEEELAGLCNTFKPNCARPDCSKIDFDLLRTFAVTPIGLTGDNRAIHRFLQRHLQFQDVEYDKMIDPNICPTGLYVLMPNRATFVVFYWRSGRHLLEIENDRITCQMIRQVRDLCSEIVVCVEEKTLLNLKFPRPERRDHLLYEDVTIEDEVTRYEANASNGFDAACEATREKVVLCSNRQNLYLCTSTGHRSSIEKYTEEKTGTFAIDNVEHLLNDYKIIWKAAVRLREDSSDIEDFLQIIFRRKEVRLVENDKKGTVRGFSSRRSDFELSWKTAISTFLATSYGAETDDSAVFNSDKKRSTPFLSTSIAWELFSQVEETIKSEFDELRKKTGILEKLLLDNKYKMDKTAFEKFYNFEQSAKEALDELKQRGKTQFGKIAVSLKNAWSNFRDTGVFDLPSEFVLPEDKELRKCHMKNFQTRRTTWLEKRIPSDIYEKIIKRFKTIIDVEKFLKETGTSLEIGTGNKILEVSQFSLQPIEQQPLALQAFGNDVRLSYRRWLMEDTIEYAVFRLEVTSDEKTAASTDPNYTFHPLFKDKSIAKMSAQNDDVEVKALYTTPYEDKLILVAYEERPNEMEKTEKESDSNDSDVVVYVGRWKNLTSNELKRFKKKRVDLVAFDAKTRLLALCDNDDKQLVIYEFTEYLMLLKHCSETSFADGCIKVLHMQFISGKRKILLVGSNGKGRIYNINLHAFTADRIDFEEEGETLADVLCHNDFVFTVTKEFSKPAVKLASDEKREVETMTASLCNFSVRAYSSETLDLIRKDKLYTFFDVSEKSRFCLVRLFSQLHLVCIDVLSGKCQSARLNLISPGTNIVTTRISNRENEDLKDNEILENFFTIFRKYPITNSYEKETKPLRLTFAIPNQPNPQDLRESFQDNVESYFHSMLKALRDETGKQVDILEKRIRLQTCFSDDLSDVFSYTSDKPVEVAHFVLTVSTAIPIQIARAENNRLIPLKKGVNVVLPGSLSSTDDVKTILSFGVYEAVLSYAKEPAKVISATGKQSVGKSFMLNHMTGSLFDIAGGRCTQGVWMAVKLYSDVTVIALDFEGLGSFERSRQEDTFMAIFGAAISSLTVFKMAPRFDEDARQMFDRFRDGANYLSQGDAKKQLFNGKLAVLCKDVPACESREVREEIKGKIVKLLVKTSDNNFVTKLYGETFRVLTSEAFGKEDMFKSFDTIKEYLHDHDPKAPDNPGSNDRRRRRIRTAQNTAHLMKTVLAKVYLQDWTALDEAEVQEILAYLKSHVESAVIRGAILVGDTTKRLEKMRSHSEIDEGTKMPDLVSEDDFNAELYAANDLKSRSTIRERLIKNYKKEHQKEIGSSEWCLSFEEQLAKLAQRRISRVEEWILLNTNDLKENSDLQCFQTETKAKYYTPLRQFLTICQQKCVECDRLCLKERHHSNSTAHHCYTDHKCEHECSYCTSSAKRIFACSYRGGHSGKHKCKENKHTCNKECELSMFRQCKEQCSQEVNHDSTPGLQQHRCDAETHYCNKKCDLAECKNQCSRSFDHEGKHQCSIDYCPEVCKMCNNRCASKDHFHSPKNNTHFCDREHACKKYCESPGHCTVVSSFEGSKESTFQGKFGDFNYVPKAKQIPKRLPCVIPIPVSKKEHKGPHRHFPDGSPEIHHCTAKCPTCKNICLKPYNHPGLHSTNHSNMVNQVFVSKSNKITLHDRTYAPGESARAEMCDQFCKRLGRGHTHLMRCPGDHTPDDIADGKVRHAVHKGPDDDDLDEVTHDYYWDYYKFEDNCNESERKLYRKCNSVCETVKETFPDLTTENESFCQLELWHEPIQEKPGKKGHISKEGHYFLCTHDTVAGYHVVLIIDKSESMGRKNQRPGINSPLRRGPLDNRLGAVLETCDEFCRRRCQEDRDFLTLITFDTAAEVQVEGDAISGGISKICKVKNVLPEGDTNFAPALEQAKKSIEDFADKTEKNKYIVPLVILLTDGNCGDKDEAIKEANLLKSDAKDFPTPIVFCIVFGNKGFKSFLQATGRTIIRRGDGLAILKAISSRGEVHQSATAVELKKVFLEFHSQMQENIGVIDKNSN